MLSINDLRFRYGKRSPLVLDGVHYRTLAINHQWRDDVTGVKMIQSVIEI